MLSEFHQIAEQCGQRLTPDEEQRYTATKSAVRSYIVKNNNLSDHPKPDIESFLAKYENQVGAST
jgi:hypothetical protein